MKTDDVFVVSTRFNLSVKKAGAKKGGRRAVKKSATAVKVKKAKTPKAPKVAKVKKKKMMMKK